VILLRDIQQGDYTFDKYKFDSLIVARNLLGTSFDKHAQRILNCANSLQMRVCDDGHLRLSQAIFCRVRCCPLCSWRRSQAWRGRILKVLPFLVAQTNTRVFIFATFTVRSPLLSELRLALAKMLRAFRNMTLARNNDWQADGYVRALEISRGKVPGYCHPHFHCILRMRSDYQSMPHDQWVKMWRKFLRVDYDPSVRINFIRDLKSSIPEIFKYVCKFTDLRDPEFCIAYMTACENMRFISLGGYFSQLLKSDEDLDQSDLIRSGLDEFLYGGDNFVKFSWFRESELSYEGNVVWAYQTG